MEQSTSTQTTHIVRVTALDLIEMLRTKGINVPGNADVICQEDKGSELDRRDVLATVRWKETK